MIGFEYKFNKPTEILDKITLLLDFSIVGYLIIILIIFVFIILVYYVFPYIYIFFENINIERAKKKRKALIHSIAIQKDIEEEIEKELDL